MCGLNIKKEEKMIFGEIRGVKTFEKFKASSVYLSQGIQVDVARDR